MTFFRFLQDFHNHVDDDHDHHHVEANSSVLMLSGNGHGNDNDDGKPWLEVFIASFLINLTTFSGVIVMVICMVFIPRGRRWFSSRNRDSTTSTSDNTKKPVLFSRVLENLVIPSFAAGALLATCVFLILPEALELLAQGGTASTMDHDDHGHHRFLQDHDHHSTKSNETATEHADGNAHEEDHDDHAGHADVFWKVGTVELYEAF